tara:strand:+ start:753 stop:1526 length:774 start_codon:yes stop_codon:yes gene_type:complete
MCKYPIMSFGIILYNNDKINSKVLMVQRKHSICYIEFLRGKYSIDLEKSYPYIECLFKRMTDNEKHKILTWNFFDLWKDLWIDINNIKQKFKDEYNKSEKKYLFLKENNKLNKLIKDTNGLFLETEWEFPKGRRNDYEKNIECAIREVEEETGLVNNKDYILYKNIFPLVDEYKSFNKVNYKHVFYIGKIINKKVIDSIQIDDSNIDQKKEINNISFLNETECIQKIRPYQENKLSIVKKIFGFISTFNNNFVEINI